MLGRVQLKSISGKSNAIERGSLAIWTGTLSSGGRLWSDDLSVGLRGKYGASVGQVQAIDCFSRARRLRTPWNPFTEWSSCIVGRPDRLAMYLFQLQIGRIGQLHSARLLVPWSSSWIFHPWYEWCWEVLPKGVESPPPPNDLPSLTALLLCQEAKRQRWWHV